ncbi:MAG TPA: hypothetical protein ENG33_09875, partial [Chloroflexi bacterium]|nr:hypothetical protein [Chloroflexota bacterium]
MKQDIERLAWLILIASFFIFCCLAVGIPLSIRWYIINAPRPHEATLTVLGSAVLVREPRSPEPVGVIESRKIREGSTVETPDESSRAVVTFFDGSTIILYGKAEVKIAAMRSPRFSWSPKPNLIHINVRKGRVRVMVSPPTERPLTFEVETPHTIANFREGSYSVDVAEDVTEIAVRDGKAIVGPPEELVTVFKGHRTLVKAGEPPGPPLPAAQNLIENGDFKEPLSPSWQIITYQDNPEAQEGEVKVVEEGGHRAVLFRRRAEEGIHTETGILQVIDKDVWDYEYLNLRLDVKLIYQSLPGAGERSSEFPLMVRVDYRDVYGIDRFWVHGFYFVDPIQRWYIINGEKIPPNVWYPYESG